MLWYTSNCWWSATRERNVVISIIFSGNVDTCCRQVVNIAWCFFSLSRCEAHLWFPQNCKFTIKRLISLHVTGGYTNSSEAFSRWGPIVKILLTSYNQHRKCISVLCSLPPMKPFWGEVVCAHECVSQTALRQLSLHGLFKLPELSKLVVTMVEYNYRVEKMFSFGFRSEKTDLIYLAIVYNKN
jgi:hypothetical protein